MSQRRPCEPARPTVPERPAPHPDVETAFLQPEAVLYDDRSGTVIHLNGSAAAVWMLLDGTLDHSTSRRRARRASSRSSADTIRPDVEAALADFAEQNLLVEGSRRLREGARHRGSRLHRVEPLPPAHLAPPASTRWSCSTTSPAVTGPTSTGVDVELVEGSILDETLLRQVAADADAVVHLAARPSVPRSIADPVASHLANASGTVAVLEAARADRRARRRRLVQQRLRVEPDAAQARGPGHPAHVAVRGQQARHRVVRERLPALATACRRWPFGSSTSSGPTSRQGTPTRPSSRRSSMPHSPGVR